MGRESAVKLRPYIKECDIFSSEAAGRSEQGADSFEKQWLSLLALSRTEFRRSLISPDNEYMAFIRELQESLHYEKKPVHILERFSETDSAMITAMAPTRKAWSRLPLGSGFFRSSFNQKKSHTRAGRSPPTMAVMIIPKVEVITA